MCKLLNEQDDTFHQDAEFTLIEQIKNQTTTKETRTLLKQRANFWVLKIKTLYPDGWNKELQYMSVLGQSLSNSQMINKT